jgi:hypothetical protein
MPIFYPDILKNNNQNFALVDITEVRGNSYPVGTLLETGSIPSDKQKIGAILFISGSQEYYGFYGQTTGSVDWNNPSNWVKFSSEQDRLLLFNEQTGSTYTLALSDLYKEIEMNSTSSNSIIIPASSSVPWEIGSQILATQVGTGSTTVSFEPGVTIQSFGGYLTFGGQYVTVTMRYVDTDVWRINGYLV